MFTASKDIAAQLAWLLASGDPPLPLAGHLGTAENRETIVARLIELRVVAVEDERDLLDLLVDLRRQELVRRVSVARDVYLRATSRWWILAGRAIEQLMQSASSYE